ncbi:MAG: tetratricopeptide repeat protein [Candidatus Hydrogenedentes bacterium]|nr:tetratricopeptide repeat protein [Candidatus Hydrogenedentota bacterium]
MPTLSVIMIVKNEAHCLAECLASVQSIADEIVIGDTGSTDTTVDIARGLGCRVFDIPWRDDFAEARNRVLAQAHGDWLLHLDADEILDADGAIRLRALVDADGAGADAVEVTLANYCDESRAWRWVPVAPGEPMARGAAGYIAAPLLRLFRGGRGFEYREPVHENITESVIERGGVIRAEPILIHHYGYRSGTTDKAALYLRIGREKARQRPEDPKAWHDLAEQLLACGQAEEAGEACRKALSLDPRHLGAATALANLLLNAGRLDEARALFEAFERDGIAPPHVVTVLGAVACRQGRLPEARARLEAVLEAAPRALHARLYLARTLDRLGEIEDARDHLRQAAAQFPSLSEPQHRLAAHRLRADGERRYEARDVQAALAALVESLRLDPEDPLTQNDLGVVLHAMGQTARARECFTRALLLAPGMAEADTNLRALSSP